MLSWDQLPMQIEPFYPKGGGSEGGRPPVPSASLENPLLQAVQLEKLLSAP